MKTIILLRNLFSVFFILICSAAFSQNMEEAITNLRHQVLDYPQEKLYVQMDKPQYEAGDTIWFRAHTVTEAFHYPSALSRGIFVNLYGPDEKLIERFTLLPMDKRLYSSFVVLPEYLPQGEYRLQAYSEQMQGKRSNAYFSSKFQVNNPVRKYVTPSKVSEKALVIQFYPEGGSLVDQHICNVAFTAKDSSGNPVDVSGSVYEVNGPAITAFRSIQAGIGSFAMPVRAGKSYYALIETSKDKTQYVEMPSVSNFGYSLKVADLIDSYYVSALQAGSEGLKEKLNVLLLLRGVPELQFKLTPEKDYIYIGKGELVSGVHDVVLMDSKMNVLSQRLLFVNNKDQARVQMTIQPSQKDTLQKISKTKKQVNLDLSVLDLEGKPLNAEFSVSIYPDTMLPVTTSLKNIESDFLLASDLNQTLSYSGKYFDGKDAISKTVLDAWLIASRWPKFDIQRAVNGNLESSWDIGAQAEASFLRDSTGIYKPLTPEEKEQRAKMRHIDLNEVNVYAEQLNKHIKPYSYVNHTIKGQDLVEGGVTIQDYLVNLPGISYDATTGSLRIRNGRVTYLLDGYQVDSLILNSLQLSEIESVDILKDAANLALLKFSSVDDTESFAIGGAIAIWTKRAIDTAPQKIKKSSLVKGQKINDEVRRMIMPGTKDIWLSQFPNTSRSNLWKPYVTTDANGKAVVRFTPDPKVKKYIIEMNGVASDGLLLYYKQSVQVPE